MYNIAMMQNISITFKHLTRCDKQAGNHTVA